MSRRDAAAWKVERIYGNKDSLEKLLTCAVSKYEEVVWREFYNLNWKYERRKEKKSSDRYCHAVQEKK